ncbi:MAG: hypothetical protein HYV15_02310, partial [Elusimicrobia bacterium]|nr:hypothetical protein [Elusimicrobiota bacterium]
EALSAARAAEAAHPGHPAGPFYADVVRFQEFVAADAASTAAYAAFESESLRAEEAARAWLSTSPALGHYYLGAVHGFRARALLARGSWASAVGGARRGAGHLRKALELDPSLVDVRLGLGMYEYYLARAPALARPLAWAVLGLWGDREKGLADLRLVAERGQAARVEALSVLSAIYASDKEGMWADSEALLVPLMERYPGNPIYRMRRAYVALRRGAYAEAARIADPGGAWLEAVPAALSRALPGGRGGAPRRRRRGRESPSRRHGGPAVAGRAAGLGRAPQGRSRGGTGGRRGGLAAGVAADGGSGLGPLPSAA